MNEHEKEFLLLGKYGGQDNLQSACICDNKNKFPICGKIKGKQSGHMPVLL